MQYYNRNILEKFEGNKGVIEYRKSKARKYNDKKKKKRTKGQTMIYNLQHRKVIRFHCGVNSGDPEG